MKLNLGQVAKAVAALTAGVTTMVAAGLLTGSTAVWATGACAAISTAVAVYAAPNRPQP